MVTNTMEQVSDAGEGAWGSQHRNMGWEAMQSRVWFGTTRPQYQTLMPSSREAWAQGGNLGSRAHPSWLLHLQTGGLFQERLTP